MSRRHRHRMRLIASQPPLAPMEDRTAEYMPTLTLDRQVAEARRSMGEEKWHRLQQEWK
jgi:hypothetical protein